MNYSTAIFLINDDARAMACSYEEFDPKSAISTKPAPTEIFKTLDAGIKEGDFVVVPTDTRHKMTVVKVVEADVDLDLDSTAPVDWIVGRVDRASHEELLALEEHAIAAIKKAEKRKKRDDMRSAIMADHEETIKELELVKLAPSLEPPKVQTAPSEEA